MSKLACFLLILIAAVFPVSAFTIQGHEQSLTALFSTPRRQPRRNLKKRRRRNPKDGSGQVIPASEDQSFWETSELRPFVAANAKEAGEDYWIDPEELRREQERKAQIRAREPGQIPDQKLWKEVLSPYKQNWIGLISVAIVVFAFIFKNFPEIIDPPLISNVPLDL